MKCTCPMQTQLSCTQREAYSTGSCWGSRWALKVALDSADKLLYTARVGPYWLPLGRGGGDALGPQGFSDTNMLV